ncbi:MAG: AI-2E family transporter [Myxococcaceae bacterium]|nr:AI-2E family transporter [Myxococcaceae bacterium]
MKPGDSPRGKLSVVGPSPDPEHLLDEAEARRIDFIWAGATTAALLGVFGLIAIFAGVAVPVLLSLAVAYVLNPLVTFLERRGLGRTWGTVTVFAVLVLLLAAFAWYLVPVVRDEASKLPEFFRQASKQVIPRIESALGISLPELIRQRTEELGTEASELVKSVGPAVARLATSFAQNTARFVATVLGLLVVPVIGFFFLRDYPVLLRQLQNLLPRRAAALVSRRFAQVDEVLSAFVQGQITVGAILSVIYSVGLSTARVDMAILIGLVAGFGNMVPYLGTAVGIVLAAFGLMLSWQGPWQLVVVVATFLGAQLLEGLVITPRIVGERVGLKPVAVIIAVLGFSELFGFVGVLLAVPVAAVLKVVLAVVVERYRKSPAYDGRVAS